MTEKEKKQRLRRTEKETDEEKQIRWCKRKSSIHSNIQVISCYKLYALSYPLSAITISSRNAKIFAVVLSIFCVVYMIGTLFIGQYFYFDPAMASCQVRLLYHVIC